MANDVPQIGENLKKQRADWRTRLDAEHDDLSQKVASLEGFVSSGQYYGVHDNEKNLLNTQLGHMKAYLKTLKARIDHHNNK